PPPVGICVRLIVDSRVVECADGVNWDCNSSRVTLVKSRNSVGRDYARRQPGNMVARHEHDERAREPPSGETSSRTTAWARPGRRWPGWYFTHKHYLRDANGVGTQLCPRQRAGLAGQHHPSVALSVEHHPDRPSREHRPAHEVLHDPPHLNPPFTLC